MGYSYLAPRFISAISIAAAVSAASFGYGQAFGRFGYTQSADMPGLRVNKEGFIAKDVAADKIYFKEPSKLWKAVATTDIEQIVQLSGFKGSPSKASFNLLAPGFSLYFQSGLQLRLHCQSAPFLTWPDGSVAQGVATPNVKWLILSFRDNQPPLAIGFPGSPSSLTISGKSGDWTLEGPPDFKGWVRIGLPVGLEQKPATTASSLGRLAKEAGPGMINWSQMPPHLLKVSYDQDLYSVTATWQFDHPGAVVPAAAQLAYLGGYPLTVKSETTRFPGWTEAGPIDVLKGTSLSIRFPVRRIPTGRALAIGQSPSAAKKPVHSANIAGIAELAEAALTADRDADTRKAAEDSIQEFVSQAPYFAEPWTRQQLPFSESGEGIDSTAAEAMLMQAVTSTSRATSESNSLLTSVGWRLDWLTWQVWVADKDVSERSAALAAVAAALCPETERRLTAGMLQAGLSAIRGLERWKRREGLVTTPSTHLESMFGIRKALFGLVGQPEPGEGYVQVLTSPLRVFSDSGVGLLQVGQDFVLKTSLPKGKNSVLMLATAYPIEVSERKNVTIRKVESVLGFTEIHCISSGGGECEFKVVLPAFGKFPPKSVPAPSYTEQRR